MSLYVFGDLHGEITKLKILLDKINYNANLKNLD